MGRCWLWGAGPPQTFSASQTFSAQVGYLPGLSVWSLHVLPVFTRGFLQTPTEKTCKNRTFSFPSVTETDGSLGPRALRSYPLLLGGPGGRTVRDGKKQRLNSQTILGLRVCVSCVA